MKRIIALLLIAAIQTGCATKIEKAQTDIARGWQISKVFEDGQDVTATFLLGFGNYHIDLNSDGAFVETYHPFSGGLLQTVQGTWSFSDGIDKLTLTDPNQTRIYQIERLDEEHLNLTDLGSNNNTELQLVPG